MKSKIIFLLALAAFASASCGNRSQVAQVAPPEYKVMTLDTATTVIYNEFSTIISSNSIVEVKPRVSGYVVKKYINEGELVTPGQLLFKIDDTEFRQQVQAAKAALESARAQISKAELEVRKLTPLVEKGIISPYELEVVNSNLVAAQAAGSQAQASYDNAMTNLGYTEIRSGEKGILGYTYASVGELVTPSNTIAEISTDGEASAYFSFDEKKLTAAMRARYQEMQRNDAQNIELMLADGSIYPYRGRLYNATGRVDPTTGSLMMKVDFENPNYSILDGTSGTLRFPVEFKGCITLPQSATYELLDKKMVFIVNEDNSVVRKVIQVEGNAGDKYVVSNLEPGTRIVTEGVDKLKEGTVITPKE